MNIDKKRALGVQKLSILTPFSMTQTPPLAKETTKAPETVQLPQAALAGFFDHVEDEADQEDRKNDMINAVDEALRDHGMETFEGAVDFFVDDDFHCVTIWITPPDSMSQEDFEAIIDKLFPNGVLKDRNAGAQFLVIPLEKPAGKKDVVSVVQETSKGRFRI